MTGIGTSTTSGEDASYRPDPCLSWGPAGAYCQSVHRIFRGTHPRDRTRGLGTNEQQSRRATDDENCRDGSQYQRVPLTFSNVFSDLTRPGNLNVNWRGVGVAALALGGLGTIY